MSDEKKDYYGERCFDCRHNFDGSCRLNPPTLVINVNDYTREWQWPIVKMEGNWESGTQWCDACSHWERERK